MGRIHPTGIQFGNSRTDCVYCQRVFKKCKKGYIFCVEGCEDYKTEQMLKEASK